MKIKSVKNIIVTGASRGIGFELVKQYINLGHNVIAISRNEEKLNSLKNSVSDNKRLIVLPIDITSINKEQFSKTISKYFKQLDVLINNAGLIINKPFIEITSSDIKMVFDTNFIAPLNIIQSLTPLLHESKLAHVVNISSMGGFQGASKFPGLSIYSSSKAALSCLTECLAEEFKDSDVKFNCLALGAVQTEMLEEAFPGYQANVSSSEMARYISEFSLHSHHMLNGKVVPVSNSTP